MVCREIYYEFMSKRRLKLVVAAVLMVTVGALGVVLAFLLRQGLAKASSWATVLVLPLTVVIAIAGIWAAVLAARGLRAGEEVADDKKAAAQGVARSGSIYQTGTRGSAIAHTGWGDISITGPGDVNTGERAATEHSDESA
jgi:hypothetical protein